MPGDVAQAIISAHCHNMNNGSNYRKRSRGMALVYMTIGMVVFIGLAAFAADWGRIQLCKTELGSAADASATAGASIVYNGAYYARGEAIRIGGMNTANGQKVNVLDGDVLIGKWDTVTKTLDTTSTTPDAVQVTTYLTDDRQNGVPLMFARLITDYKTASVQKTSVARWVKVPGIYQNIAATANPFLAGMPKGSVASLNNPHNSPDYAGKEFATDAASIKQSPVRANENGTPMTVKGGMDFTFDSISGTARHDPNLAYFEPDGELADIGSNTNGNENGILGLKAPINALVGIFLDDNAPNLTPAPTVANRYDADSPTDFSLPSERNRLTYRPQLKQIFFIGDGMTDDQVKQKFVAPKGATRLYLATWDFYEWNNNAGQRLVQINGSGYVEIVK
jgi:hypothetical protein